MKKITKYYSEYNFSFFDKRNKKIKIIQSVLFQKKLMETKINKLQIAAFTTNSEFYIPFEIFSIYSEKNPHHGSIIKKENFFRFFFTVSETKYLAIIHPINNLSKIDDVCSYTDCIVFFIDLESQNSKELTEKITNYIRDNFPSDKKVYVIGMTSDKTKNIVDFGEKEICDVLEKSNLLFDYKEVCSNEKSEVTSAIDFILSDNIEVFCDFQKHSAMELRLDRCNSGPCIIM